MYYYYYIIIITGLSKVHTNKWQCIIYYYIIEITRLSAVRSIVRRVRRRQRQVVDVPRHEPPGEQLPDGEAHRPHGGKKE